jgi:hypothetical protein
MSVVSLIKYYKYGVFGKSASHSVGCLSALERRALPAYGSIFTLILFSLKMAF